MMDWQKLQDRPALQQYGLTPFLVILRISNTLGSVPGNCRPGALYVLFFRGGSCQPSLGPGGGNVRHSFGRVGDLVFPPRTAILIHFLAATRRHHPDLLLCSCNRHKFSAPSQLKRIKTRKENKDKKLLLPRGWLARFLRAGRLTRSPLPTSIAS